MSFADTWAEEKRKYGIISDTKDVYIALRSFMTLPNKILGVFRARTHAKAYGIIKEKIEYKDFKKKMIQVVRKKQEESNKNVQKAKAELLNTLKDPALKQAMHEYLKKQGKDFGIRNQRRKELENAFIENADEFLSKFRKKHWLKESENEKELIEKYKKELSMLDMYWPGMSKRERMVALGSLYDYYKSRKKLLER